MAAEFWKYSNRFIECIIAAQPNLCDNIECERETEKSGRVPLLKRLAVDMSKDLFRLVVFFTGVCGWLRGHKSVSQPHEL